LKTEFGEIFILLLLDVRSVGQADAFAVIRGSDFAERSGEEAGKHSESKEGSSQPEEAWGRGLGGRVLFRHERQI
jgi:hypothetical protein